MNNAITTHLAQVLAGHVLPALENHGIEPLRIEIHRPDNQEHSLYQDCRDSHGQAEGPVATLPAVLEVQITALDWAKLFCPVQSQARQDVSRVVDICDPAAAEYVLGYGTGIGERWTVARVHCSGGQAKRATFRAMDGAYPGVVWMCATKECATYAELEAWLIAWETKEDRHHLPGGVL